MGSIKAREGGRLQPGCNPTMRPSRVPWGGCGKEFPCVAANCRKIKTPAAGPGQRWDYRQPHRTPPVAAGQEEAGKVALRLGLGDWGNEEITKGEARDWFLAAVRRVAPEVLEALRGDPWRAYRLLRAERDICRDPEGWAQVTARYPERHGDRVCLFCRECNGHSLLGLRWSTVRVAEGPFLADLLPLQRALRVWAERHNLGERHLPAGDWWALDVALDTLRLWTDYPKAAERLGWNLPGWATYAPIQDEERRFRFEHPGWDPVGMANAGETRAEARRRMLATFEARLDEYLDRMEALAEERGLKKTPVKRNRNGSPVLHFEWLVNYQVQGRDCEELSQEYTDADPEGDRVIGSDAIRKAIAETARLVGLTLLRN